MRIMDVKIEKFKKDYRYLVENLIEDGFVKCDIINCLDEFENCGLVVFEESEIIAVGVFTGGEKKTSFILYVKPSRRNKGVGSKLLDAIENKMREYGVEEVVCDYKVNEREQKFLYNRGYKHWFKSNFMTYTGNKIIYENKYKIIGYEDKYYSESQRIMSSAFHRMRVSVGLESEEEMPCDEQRNWYRDNSENIFLLYNDEKIVGVVIIAGNKIDAVAVDIVEQGKGYGKALITHGINKLIDRACNRVVDGNSAKSLYEKIGFTKQYTHELDSKIIRD